MTDAASTQATLARDIARSSLALTRDDVPTDIWDYTKACIADALGIGFASHHYDFAATTVAGVRSLGGAGTAPVIGLEESFDPRDAALLNGTLIHGLDFDDTHLASVVHCSASAVPVALAVASQTPVSGEELVLAVLIATEIDARLGSAAGGTFQQLGFHPTGLVGIFGATVAAVRLLGGTEDDAVRAQGLALSMAGGSMAFLDEGSWTKRVHPGWAAQSALTAAKLAMSGFQAPTEAYAGRYGFFALYTQDATNVNRVNWQEAFREFAMASVAIKPYPICHFNHAPVDAALALRELHGLDPDAIESVTVHLHERQFGVVVDPLERKRRPQSEYDAKFSAPYAVSAALVRGKLGLRELDGDSRQDPAILALCQRIDCRHDDRSQYPKTFSGGVRIRMRDGAEYEHFDLINRGAEGRLLDRAAVKDKFLQNCRLVLNQERSDALWQAVMTVDDESEVRHLLNALSGLGQVASTQSQIRSAAC